MSRVAICDSRAARNLPIRHVLTSRRPVLGTSDDSTFPIAADSNPYGKGGVISTVVVMTNLLVDLLYGWLDPRIRLGD